MHHAAREGHANCVKLLLEAGADMDKRDKRGCTPLHNAAKNGHAACGQLLLDAGADATVRNADGKTAFDLMAGKLEEGMKAVAALQRAAAVQ